VYCVLTIVQISYVKLHLLAGTRVTILISVVVIRTATIVIAVSVGIGWKATIISGLVGIIICHGSIGFCTSLKDIGFVVGLWD
jgi:intracellular septation protein A